jgi:oxygen-independent coproporphyrinogen-3 oxidase
MVAKPGLHVDIDLLKKYDRPGPRYTSYPTAPYFHAGIDADFYLERVREDNAKRKDEALSLYFHLPFCDTLCYFCGCTMLVTRNRDRIEEYITYLDREMALMRPHLHDQRKVVQLHWGGGTPTHLSPDQIRRLGDAIHRHFTFAGEAEIGVEIDPRELTREHMQALREVGFNRCSMGVQDFDPLVQKTVNRIQPENITRDAVNWARELGFTSLNLDLMYGLPHQSTDMFAKTLAAIIALDPDRLAVFNYAHLPDLIKHQRVLKDDWLPGPEAKLALLKQAIESLTAAGYRYIGMDHFAKPEDELSLALASGSLYRNFQGYSTHAGINVLSFGMSSISQLSNLYAQNEKELKHYYAAIDAGRLPIMRGIELTSEDVLRRDVITEIMCNFVLTKAAINQRYGIDFDTHFAEALAEMTSFTDDGLVELYDDRLVITEAGRLLIRNIAMNFDAYLMAKTGDKPQFSRTV